MRPLTIIIFGFVLSSRILTEFFSFLSPLGNPSYILLGMFSVYLSTKSKIGIFLIIFIYDISILFRNIGFLEMSFASYTKSANILNMGVVVTYLLYLSLIIFMVFFNGIMSFVVGYGVRKKHNIGL